MTEGAPADKAGLKANDVIIKVNDKAIKDSNDLVQVIADTDPGDIVTFSVYRQGDELTLTVEIGSKTESALKNEEAAAASGQQTESQQSQPDDFGAGGQQGMQGWGGNDFEDFFQYFFGY